MSQHQDAANDLLKIIARITSIASTESNKFDGNLFLYLTKAVEIGFIEDAQLPYLLKRICRALEQQLCTVEELTYAFSQGQLKSKWWLVDECTKLNLDLKTVFLCCGWFGTLFLSKQLKFDKVRSFDEDPRCYKVANTLMHELLTDNWRFLATTLNVEKLKYDDFSYEIITNEGPTVTLTDTANTIINTSCEHMADFYLWYSQIPENRLVILQSNDGRTIPGHINCSDSLEEFSHKAPLRKTLYSGQLQLPKFTRFMRIGYK